MGNRILRTKIGLYRDGVLLVGMSPLKRWTRYQRSSRPWPRTKLRTARWRVVVILATAYPLMSLKSRMNITTMFHAEVNAISDTDARIASSANGRKHYSMVVLHHPLSEGVFLSFIRHRLDFGKNPDETNSCACDFG